MNRVKFLVFGVCISASFYGCDNLHRDFKEDIQGWMYLTTYKILPLRTIEINGRTSKINIGSNSVLSVEITKKVIFKPGIEGSTDFVSYNALLLELNPEDSIVTPNSLGKSKILRNVFEHPLEIHTYSLKADERIEIRKLTSTRWKVSSNLEDFQFEGEFSFADSSTVTSKHKEIVASDK